MENSSGNETQHRSPHIGKPVNRVDGIAKVTGSATYTAEVKIEGMLYGVIINSEITKGTINEIDASAALAVPGVVHFFDHTNRPSLSSFDVKYKDMDAPPGSPFKPLKDNKIKFNGQPIGLIVAEKFEIARYAATLVRVTYDTSETIQTDILEHLEKSRKPVPGLLNAVKPLPPKPKGDFEKAYAASAFKTEQQILHGQEHHNPLELFSSLAVYEGDGKVTIYDKTQGAINSQLYVANVFGLHFKNVRVISHYVGGAFGAGLRPQYQLFFATMAALQLKRPVRVNMTREQMFTFGHRPSTVQHILYGANADGKLTAVNHKAWAETSRFEDYTEVVVNWTNKLYPAPNVKLEYELVPLDLYTPIDMRAPGGSTGSHATESGMDQLAYELNIDPLELRFINYADKDPESGKPFTSKELKACYLQGAERFGWAGRTPEPRSMRRGKKLVGMGMATGIWDTIQLPARAEALLGRDGKFRVSSATADIGTGTYTIMTQIAADEFGVDINDVIFSLGDSKMPFAPYEGGSLTAASVGAAVQAACRGLKKKLFKLAKGVRHSGFSRARFDEVDFADSKMYWKKDRSVFLDLQATIEANKGRPVKSIDTGTPHTLKLRKYAKAVHSASFVEVEVDEDFGEVKVTRAVTAVAGGRIINPKTARSQILGSMVWGISKALREESVMDHRYGRFMNHNLSEYHIPVHADVHDLDVIFVEEHDSVINELGVKGIGEIGLVGMPPAVANAVYHATGIRVKKFPIYMDALI
jgi:xanthine dehydrogenase YagR molybdenum-binding subunit